MKLPQRAPKFRRPSSCRLPLPPGQPGGFDSESGGSCSGTVVNHGHSGSLLPPSGLRVCQSSQLKAQSESAWNQGPARILCPTIMIKPTLASSPVRHLRERPRMGWSSDKLGQQVAPSRQVEAALGRANRRSRASPLAKPATQTALTVWSAVGSYEPAPSASSLLQVGRPGRDRLGGDVREARQPAQSDVWWQQTTGILAYQPSHGWIAVCRL